MTIKKQVQKAIPFECKVKLGNGTFIRAIVKGRLLDFPQVATKYGDIQISWLLAYRLINGLSPYVNCDMA